MTDDRHRPKVATESGREADPLRVIRLMWEPPAPPRRGPKPKISLGDLVGAGVRVADEKGIDGLSMRGVASELGVGAMSLYTYVASKADLVELMVDTVFGEQRAIDTGAHWRARLVMLAEDHWAIYHRHPWLLQTNLWRCSWGPNVMDATEALYAALDAAGLTPAMIVASAAVVEAFVQGAARNSVIDTATEQESGVALHDFLVARLGFYERMVDPERYPMHTIIHAAGGFEQPSDPFRFGLERVLEAIEGLRHGRGEGGAAHRAPIRRSPSDGS